MRGGGAQSHRHTRRVDPATRLERTAKWHFGWACVLLNESPPRSNAANTPGRASRGKMSRRSRVISAPSLRIASNGGG